MLQSSHRAGRWRLRSQRSRRSLPSRRRGCRAYRTVVRVGLSAGRARWLLERRQALRARRPHVGLHETHARQTHFVKRANLNIIGLDVAELEVTSLQAAGEVEEYPLVRKRDV